jgi:group I intron endonuclease
MKTYSIYIITCVVNAKQYIGITYSLRKRWNEHRLAKRDTALHNAIRKHGLDNFVFTNFASSYDWESACYIEQMLIAEKNTMTPYGYNMTAGGEGAFGVKQSAESLAKRSAKLKGKPLSEEHKAKIGATNAIRLKGKVQSEETKLKRSKAMKGFKMPEEAKQKIANTLTGKKRPPEVNAKISLANTGKKVSAETKAKMSASQKGKSKNKGRILSDEHKEKLSIIGKQRKVSEETKAKIKASWVIRKAKLSASNNLLSETLT